MKVVSALKVPAGFHCSGSTEPFMWPISALLLAASLRYLQFLAPLENQTTSTVTAFIVCSCNKNKHRPQIFYQVFFQSFSWGHTTACSSATCTYWAQRGSVMSCVCPDVWKKPDLRGSERDFWALEWHLSMIQDDSNYSHTWLNNRDFSMVLRRCHNWMC